MLLQCNIVESIIRELRCVWEIEENIRDVLLQLSVIRSRSRHMNLTVV
jgi:hypothetical protein